MSAPALAMTLRLDRFDGLHVVRVKIVEGLSERTRANVDVATDRYHPFEQALGEPATLELSGPNPRTWSLRVASAEFIEHKDGSLHFRLELIDLMGLLGLRKNTRKFRNLAAHQIVSKVLGEAAVEHAFSLSAAVPVRPYCVQYRETDLAFVERLMEFEGIYYAIHDDGTPEFRDASGAAEMLSRVPLELVESAGALANDEEGIHVIRRGARTATGAVTCGDYNWKNPKLDLKQTHFAQKDNELEEYLYPAGFRLPADGTRLAKIRTEAHRVGARFVHGRASLATFRPGAGFPFGAGAGAAFEGEYLITRVEHTFHASELNGGAARYENVFDGIPLDTPFRPPLKTPRPTIGGTHTAMVRGPGGEEIHTDSFGRFKAQFHWDREGTQSDADSGWVRLLQETATSQTLARTGWEMFVGYVDGDPDRPIGLGRAINGVSIPTYAQPASMNVMSIKTPSSPSTGGYNELKMDDSAGAQGISMRAEKDLDALVKNDKLETIGNDETHTVGVDMTRQTLANQTITIGGNADATYDNNEQITVEGNRSYRVGASETIHVGAGQGTATGGSETEKVGTMRLTIAGAIKPPNFAALAQSAGMAILSSASPGAAQALAVAQQIRGTVTGGAGGLTNAASSAAGAATTALLQGKGLSGAGDAAAGSLNSLLPSQQSIQQVAQQRWLPSASGLKNAVKDTVAQMVSVDNVVNLCCAGGIERMASVKCFKLVGGVYLTVALLGIDVKVGLAYFETIGGVKLSLAAKAITSSVDGKLILTVGGAIMRTTPGLISLSTKKTTAVSVGLAAAYKTQDSLLIKATTVKIAAKSAMTLKSGSVQIALDGSSAKLTGKLSMTAGQDIVITGHTLDLT